ncbi:hypothetical protein AB0M32_16315 [Streptomyces sp. NPDC051985]|uniref:AMP-binding enzyme n=1 Tax=Streptomyces sp. NPDC051985 TaxID=3155807 RepID=UPI003433EAF2
MTTVGGIGRAGVDDYLCPQGRCSALSVSGGVNGYPAEIAQALIAHPDITDVPVSGVPDPERGQNAVAVVQPEDPEPDTVQLALALDAFAPAQPAGFKRPRRFEFLTQFPRTESGKVQRRVLRAAYFPGETR